MTYGYEATEAAAAPAAVADGDVVVVVTDWAAGFDTDCVIAVGITIPTM